MEAELVALEKALGDPQRPVAAVVGGAKVSSKLAVLGHLVGKVDHLIIGGGMANTFLAARGVDVGKSLCEHDLTGEAEAIFATAEAVNCTIHLPYDVVVAKEFAANPPSLRTCNVHEVAADEMILDVGPAAVEALSDVLKKLPDIGVERSARRVRDSAVRRRHRRAGQDRGSADPGRQPGLGRGGAGTPLRRSTMPGWCPISPSSRPAGGAFLEWMEGRTLPGVAALSGTQ